MLAETTDPAEQLEILETSLIGDSQVIVDIYSRYLFEKEVFERREKSELSADDLCDIMRRAQVATYGDGVDPQHLHPYMWTWKPHYYRAEHVVLQLPVRVRPAVRHRAVRDLPAARGRPSCRITSTSLRRRARHAAADLAARFGIDLRGRKFWDDSLAVIGERIDRYCAL